MGLAKSEGALGTSRLRSIRESSRVMSAISGDIKFTWPGSIKGGKGIPPPAGILRRWFAHFRGLGWPGGKVVWPGPRDYCLGGFDNGSRDPDLWDPLGASVTAIRMIVIHRGSGAPLRKLQT